MQVGVLFLSAGKCCAGNGSGSDGFWLLGGNTYEAFFSTKKRDSPFAASRERHLWPITVWLQ